MPRRMLAVDRAAAWRAVGLPALAALAALLASGLLLALAPDGVTLETLQPAESAGEPEQWGWAVETAPAWVAAFFLLDSLFAAASGWVFYRLWKALPQHPMAALGLGAALLKAGADLLENLLHFLPAIEALAAGASSPPPVGTLVALATVKRVAAAATGLAFAFGLPGRSGAAWLARAILAGMGLAAALGFFLPPLKLAHVTLLFGFLAFLLWYRKRAADELG